MRLLSSAPMLAVALAVSLFACTSTRYSERGNQIIIHGGTGGLVRSIERRYALWRHQGRDLIIDGHVISADAIEAFSYPRACYTERAIWSPHAYSNLGIYRMAGETKMAARKLPDPLEEWFTGNMAFHDWLGFARVDYEKLLAIWPEGACNQDHAKMASSDPDWRPPSTPRSRWLDRYMD